MTPDESRKPYLEPFRRHRPADEWFVVAYGCGAGAEGRKIGERWPQLPRLRDDERDEVHRLIDEYAAERFAERDKHRQRLERVARNLGREVGHGRMTWPDAEARLDRLVDQMDQPADQGGLRLVPRDEAIEIVHVAYARAIQEARRDD